MKQITIAAFVIMVSAVSTIYQNQQEPKHLYMMYSDVYDLYKIGVSNDPYRRQSEVDGFVRGDIMLLKIYPHMQSIEKELHKRYRLQRVRFSDKRKVKSIEWFRLSTQQLMEIDSIVIERKLATYHSN